MLGLTYSMRRRALLHRCHLCEHCGWLPPAAADPELGTLQTGFLAAFGGGLLSAFLLQDPKKFGISLFTDNTLGVTWTICWWLINYCPYDAVNRVHSFLPVRVVTKV